MPRRETRGRRSNMCLAFGRAFLPHFSSSRVPHVHLSPFSPPHTDDHCSPASAGRGSGRGTGLTHGAGTRTGSRSHAATSRVGPGRQNYAKGRASPGHCARTRSRTRALADSSGTAAPQGTRTVHNNHSSIPRPSSLVPPFTRHKHTLLPTLYRTCILISLPPSRTLPPPPLHIARPRQIPRHLLLLLF